MWLQDVVAHFVAHYRLNFFGRAATEEIVVQSDAHGFAKAADVGAHAGGLPRCVDLENVMRGNAIGAGHGQDGLSNFGIVKAGDFVEHRQQINRARSSR